MLRLCIGLLLCAVVAGPGAGSADKAFKQTADELKIFELCNQERKKKEVRPFKLSPALSKIARAHSENMARQGMLEHELDKKGPSDRATDAGYQWLGIGENICLGGDGATAQSAMSIWLDSKEHAANITAAEFTEIGVGIARDKDNRVYFTQVFAKPR